MQRMVVGADLVCFVVAESPRGTRAPHGGQSELVLKLMSVPITVVLVLPDVTVSVSEYITVEGSVDQPSPETSKRYDSPMGTNDGTGTVDGGAAV
jgi:hypothetical protein